MASNILAKMGASTRRASYWGQCDRRPSLLFPSKMAPTFEEDGESNGSKSRDDDDYFGDESNDESEDEFEEHGGRHERSWLGTFCLILRYSLNIGTIWRLPVILCKHGEGSFLIIYIVMLILLGIPLCCLGLALGQCVGLGAINTWKVTKITTGIGYGMCCLIVSVTVYMNIVVAWSFYYFFASMHQDLPCTSCEYVYNCPMVANTTHFFYCLHRIEHELEINFNASADASFVFYNGNNTTSTMSLIEQALANLNIDSESMLISMGELHWPIILCLFAIWSITYIGVIKGIKQVAYVGALLILLISGYIFGIAVTLEKRVAGIVDFFHFTWDKMLVVEMWHDAATQVLFSLGVCFGWPINLSSRKRYRGSCYTDSMWLVTGNALASLWMGLVTFSIAGSRRYLHIFQYGLHENGAFVFIGVSSMLAQLPAKTLTTVLFFLGVIFIGIAFNVSLAKVIFYWLKSIPLIMSKMRKKLLLLAAMVCIVSFAFGCTLATAAGYSLVIIFDRFLIGWTAMLFALIECVVFSWFYGSKRITNMIEMKTGITSFIPWRFLWQFVTPIILMFAFFGKWVFTNEDVSIRVRYDTIVGRILSSLPFCIIVIYMAFVLIRQYRRNSKHMVAVFKLSPSFGSSTDSTSPFEPPSIFVPQSHNDFSSVPDPIVLVHVEDEAFGIIPHGFFLNLNKRKSISHVQQTHVLIPPNGQWSLGQEVILDKQTTAENGSSVESFPLTTPWKDNGNSPMIIRAQRMLFPSTLSANSLSAITVVPSWMARTSDKQRLCSIRRSFRSLRRSKSNTDISTVEILSDKYDCRRKRASQSESLSKIETKSTSIHHLLPPDAHDMGTSNPTFVIEEFP